MLKLAIVAVVVISAFASILPTPGARADTSCLETGAGAVHPGSWHTLSRTDRVARCQEAERRAQERQDRARDNEAAREERSRRGEPGGKTGAESRQQECLVNAAACDTPGGSDGSSATDDSTRSRRRR